MKNFYSDLFSEPVTNKYVNNIASYPVCTYVMEVQGIHGISSVYYFIFYFMYYIISNRVSIILIHCINNDFPSSIHL